MSKYKVNKDGEIELDGQTYNSDEVVKLLNNKETKYENDSKELELLLEDLEELVRHQESYVKDLDLSISIYGVEFMKDPTKVNSQKNGLILIEKKNALSSLLQTIKDYRQNVRIFKSRF